MKHVWLSLCLPLIILAVARGSVSPAAAQGNDWVLVPIRTIATEREDDVEVEVYFSLRDLQGRVVTREAAGLDQTGTVLMRTGPSGNSQPASISDPNTPISIILLIDSSGSMANAIGNVIAAAQKAVDEAPDNAVFSVFNFNNVALDQAFNPMIAQSTDREQVKRVIGDIRAVRGGITCMYNAAYKVLEHPSSQVTSALPRSALIIFTDGKDDNGQGGRCSSITEAGLVGRARESMTQVHTIGLCTDGNCSNVDKVGLEALARDSAGFSAFGELNQISNTFGQIMAAINAQFVARMRVLAARGENLGRLEVTTRNQSLPIAGDFVFNSSKDYFLNATFSLGRRYDPVTNTYQIGIVIDNPQTIARVTVSILDSQAGTIIGDEIVLDVPPDAKERVQLTTDYPADALVSGTEYCFQLRAVNKSGERILVASQSGGGQQEIIKEDCGQHKQTISFDIAEIIPNYEAGKLIVRLNIVGTSPNRANISGEILDKDEVQIARIDPQLPDEDGTLTLNMPANLLEQNPGDFTLRLVFAGVDVPPAVRKFRHQPPEQPLPIAPIVAVTAAVLMFVIGILYARRRPAASTALPKPEPIRSGSGSPDNGGIGSRFSGTPQPPAPPPIAPSGRAAEQEVTSIYSANQLQLGAGVGAAGSVSKARVRFLRSPTGQLQPERIVTSFPCTVGRAGNLIISGDSQVSRTHIQLSLQNGALYLTDIGSTHGTQIAGRSLPPNAPQQITAPTRVTLGQQTELEISPMAG